MTDKYTTQLGAGLGMIDETRLFISLWDVGMNGTDLYRRVLESGRFPTMSSRRLHDFVTVGFAKRYLVDDGEPARFLKQAMDVLGKREFEQLLFIYTCRVHLILADFVREVYWSAYAAGKATVTNDDARAFVVEAIRDGKTTMAWSDSMVRRVSSYLTGCCADFGLLEKDAKRVRPLLPFRVEPAVVAFLAYDLHFAEQTDAQVLNHPDWQIFGLDAQDVLEELRRLALRDLVVVQSGGGVTRIEWPYRTMEAVIHALA